MLNEILVNFRNTDTQIEEINRYLNRIRQHNFECNKFPKINLTMATDLHFGKWHTHNTRFKRMRDMFNKFVKQFHFNECSRPLWTGIKHQVMPMPTKPTLAHAPSIPRIEPIKYERWQIIYFELYWKLLNASSGLNPSQWKVSLYIFTLIEMITFALHTTENADIYKYFGPLNHIFNAAVFSIQRIKLKTNTHSQKNTKFNLTFFRHVQHWESKSPMSA